MTVVTSNKYNNLVMSNGKCYAFTSMFKHEDITDNIKATHIVYKNSNFINTYRTYSNSLFGAIFGGIVGAISSALINSNALHYQMLVQLDNNEEMLVETDDRLLIEFLCEFLPPKKIKRR